MSLTPKPITRLSQTLTVLKLIHRDNKFPMLRWIILLTMAESVDAEGKPTPMDIQEISYRIGKAQNALVNAMADDGLVAGTLGKFWLTDKGVAEVRRIIDGRTLGQLPSTGPAVDMERVRSFVGHVATEDRS